MKKIAITAFLSMCGVVFALCLTKGLSAQAASVVVTRQRMQAPTLKDGMRVPKEQLAGTYDGIPEAVDLGLSVKWAPF